MIPFGTSKLVCSGLVIFAADWVGGGKDEMGSLQRKAACPKTESIENTLDAFWALSENYFARIIMSEALRKRETEQGGEYFRLRETHQDSDFTWATASFMR